MPAPTRSFSRPLGAAGLDEVGDGIAWHAVLGKLDGHAPIAKSEDVAPEAPPLRIAPQALEAAYRELVFLAERIDRGEKIESWELHDIARRLRRG